MGSSANVAGALHGVPSAGVAGHGWAPSSRGGVLTVTRRGSSSTVYSNVIYGERSRIYLSVYRLATAACGLGESWSAS